MYLCYIPDGPPNSTCHSLLMAIQPSPPSPPSTLILATSKNIHSLLQLYVNEEYHTLIHKYFTHSFLVSFDLG